MAIRDLLKALSAWPDKPKYYPRHLMPSMHLADVETKVGRPPTTIRTGPHGFFLVYPVEDGRVVITASFSNGNFLQSPVLYPIHG